jgi:hypothetical protein
MITVVRFPTSFAVIRNILRVEWRPGEHGVDLIGWCGDYLAFYMSNGDSVVVVPPPGTVVTTTDRESDPVATEPDAEKPSAPGESLPPAEPRKKGRRV